MLLYVVLLIKSRAKNPNLETNLTLTFPFFQVFICFPNTYSFLCLKKINYMVFAVGFTKIA